MASLPADRTKLQVAISNQQPSIVAASQANREALVEAYDTVDLLNQKVDNAISVGTLTDEIVSDVDMNGYSLLNVNKLSYADATVLTISGGVITATQAYHRVDTEASAATDDLDTINGGTAGQVLFLRSVSAVRKVVIKHGTGNLFNPEGVDITLDNINHIAPFMCTGAQWIYVGNWGVKRSGDVMAGHLDFQPNAGPRFEGFLAELANFPYATAEDVTIRLLRTTNTSGKKFFTIGRGDGTSGASFIIENGFITRFGDLALSILGGSAHPEGNVTANPGSTYHRTTGSLFVKETGTGNTGWKLVTVA